MEDSQAKNSSKRYGVIAMIIAFILGVLVTIAVFLFSGEFSQGNIFVREPSVKLEQEGIHKLEQEGIHKLDNDSLNQLEQDGIHKLQPNL